MKVANVCKRLASEVAAPAEADARAVLQAYQSGLATRRRLADAVARVAGPERARTQVLNNFVFPTLAEVVGAEPILQSLRRQAQMNRARPDQETVAAMISLANREAPINRYLHANHLTACATY